MHVFIHTLVFYLNWLLLSQCSHHLSKLSILPICWNLPDRYYQTRSIPERQIGFQLPMGYTVLNTPLAPLTQNIRITLEDLNTHSYLPCPTYLCLANLYASAKMSIQMSSTQTHVLTRFYLYCVLSQSTEASCASFIAFPKVLMTCMSLEHPSPPAGVLHEGKHHLPYAQQWIPASSWVPRIEFGFINICEISE